ncbi:MAG: peptidyl-prolyl cis-trans isomerase [Prosthecobacter sp.]|nr:peptidyl-prolyl cis-trans isomerase [Prosthecobacter sp.]
MLEFFRKHRGAFLITLTVIIIVSFSVWGGWKDSSGDVRSRGEETAFTIYGKDYTGAEAARYERYMRLLYMLQMFDLVQGLMQVAESPDTRGNDFIFNLLVLRHEMEKAGVHPSDAEADAEIRKLPALQENGAFSPQRAQMAEANFGMYGMSGEDMREIVKLNIGFKKLQDLIGKNYVPSPLGVEKAYASKHQTLKISTIPFLLNDLKKTVQLTDAEIQKYYDEKKDTFKTAEKRTISYVFFEEPADLDKKPADEQKKLREAVVGRVNKFSDETIKPNADLGKIATGLKEKVLTLPAFARDAAPEAIKAEAELMDAIFAFNKADHPISNPIKGSKGFYIFTVTQIEEPKQQDLATVKDKIKETLTAQKAQEALSKAINEARKALVDGLKAGKKIEDLAKEKKLTLTPMVDLDVSEPAQSIPNAYDIVRQAESTPAGQMAPVVDTKTDALLVYVHAKELRKRDDSAALRKNTEQSTAQMERMRIFSAWFSRKREEAQVKLSPEAVSS